MEYQVRTPRDTARNAKRTRYWWKYSSFLEVLDELIRMGVTEYPAKHKWMSDDEYKQGLIEILIDNEPRIA